MNETEHYGDPHADEEQRQRRASIKNIMADQSLTPLERRRSIQGLMDGRRRSSVASRSSIRGSQRGSGLTGMAAAAAAAALEYDSSDDEGGPTAHDASPGQYFGGDVNGGGGGAGGGLPNPGASAAQFRRRSLVSVASTVEGSDDEVEGANGFNGFNDGGMASRRNSIHEAGSSVGSDLSGGGTTNNHSNPDPDVLFAQQSIAMAAAVAHHENPGSQKAMDFSRRMEQQRPQCTHYDRKCTPIAFCCGLAFGCRICHDDMPVLPPPVYDMQRADIIANTNGGGWTGGAHDSAALSDSEEMAPPTTGKRRVARSSSMPQTSAYTENLPDHHTIDRFAIAEVICRVCYYRQSSKTNNCKNCGVKFGEYHCDVCNLWMSDEENPYHCKECGFCRVGGKENFQHCFDCGMCIDAYLFNDHNCKVGKYMSNCPVCQEDLFSSRSASHEMPCGHAIHWHCFRELTSFDSRCPVCKKTAESHERMAPTWSAMAMGIALQPVPPELARVVTIVCTDCEVKEVNRRWHFLGVQCRHCTSFNTVIENTTLTGPEAAAFLGEHEGSDEARAVLDDAMDTGREVGDLNFAGMDVMDD